MQKELRQQLTKLKHVWALKPVLILISNDSFLVKWSTKMKLNSVWKIHGITWNIYDLSFIKWPRNFKGQFRGHIQLWFQWKNAMNIKSYHTFVKWYTKPMFDAWFLTCGCFCLNKSLHLYIYIYVLYHSYFDLSGTLFPFPNINGQNSWHFLYWIFVLL